MAAGFFGGPNMCDSIFLAGADMCESTCVQCVMYVCVCVICVLCSVGDV